MLCAYMVRHLPLSNEQGGTGVVGVDGVEEGALLHLGWVTAVRDHLQFHMKMKSNQNLSGIKFTTQHVRC